jgi:hypothetical protein
MVFINPNLFRAKYLFVSLLIAIFWIGFCQLATAKIAENLSATNSFAISGISVIQEIKEPIDLKKFNLEYWQDNPEFAPNKKRNRSGGDEIW